MLDQLLFSSGKEVEADRKEPLQGRHDEAGGGLFAFLLVLVLLNLLFLKGDDKQSTLLRNETFWPQHHFSLYQKFPINSCVD